jgi:hypothetical protein
MTEGRRDPRLNSRQKTTIKSLYYSWWRRLPLWAKILLYGVYFVVLSYIQSYIPSLLPNFLAFLLQEFKIAGITFKQEGCPKDCPLFKGPPQPSGGGAFGGIVIGLLGLACRIFKKLF